MTANKENNIIEQVSAIVWKKDENGLEFLLVQELNGIWSLPGGAKETTDTTLTHAMKRELQEELGLQEEDYELTLTEIQARFLYDRPGSSRYGKEGVLTLFLVKPKDWSKIVSTNHLSKIGWFAVDQAKKMFVFSHHSELADQAAKILQS